MVCGKSNENFVVRLRCDARENTHGRFLIADEQISEHAGERKEVPSWLTNVRCSSTMDTRDERRS